MIGLIQRINGLGDDEALEAVNLLGGLTLGAKPDAELLDDAAASTDRTDTEVELALRRVSPAEAADFARVVLVAHTLSGAGDDVERAIDAAGEKAIVLEIALIGLLGLGILHLALTRGRKQQK